MKKTLIEIDGRRGEKIEFNSRLCYIKWIDPRPENWLKGKWR